MPKTYFGNTPPRQPRTARGILSRQSSVQTTYCDIEEELRKRNSPAKVKNLRDPGVILPAMYCGMDGKENYE